MASHANLFYMVTLIRASMACGLQLNRPKCTRSSPARKKQLEKESRVEEAAWDESEAFWGIWIFNEHSCPAWQGWGSSTPYIATFLKRQSWKSLPPQKSLNKEPSICSESLSSVKQEKLILIFINYLAGKVWRELKKVREREREVSNKISK